MRKIAVYADNPVQLDVALTKLNAARQEVPLTDADGAVTAFFASAKTSAAVALGTLTTSLVHVAAGVWALDFTAVQMAYGTVNPLLAAVSPLYIIIVKANGLREYIEVQYFPEKPAQLAAR